MRAKWFAAAILLSALVGFPAAADKWSPLTRERALEQTQSRFIEERRLAYGRLAEVGTLEDVPVLLAALWDEEALIRGMAEQAVWGIWMRTDDSVADPLFQTGMQMLVEDKPALALEKFNEVILLKPEFAEAWSRRADAYRNLGDSERALADYEHALVLNPGNFGAMENCGHVWLERGDRRKAAGYFRRAVEINPNLWHIVELLGELEQALANDRI